MATYKWERERERERESTHFDRLHSCCKCVSVCLCNRLSKLDILQCGKRPSNSKLSNCLRRSRGEENSTKEEEEEGRSTLTWRQLELEGLSQLHSVQCIVHKVTIRFIHFFPCSTLTLCPPFTRVTLPPVVLSSCNYPNVTFVKSSFKFQVSVTSKSVSAPLPLSLCHEKNDSNGRESFPCTADASHWAGYKFLEEKLSSLSFSPSLSQLWGEKEKIPWLLNSGEGKSNKKRSQLKAPGAVWN